MLCSVVVVVVDDVVSEEKTLFGLGDFREKGREREMGMCFVYVWCEWWSVTFWKRTQHLQGFCFVLNERKINK